MPGKVLKCIGCENKFTEDDVLNLEFFLDVFYCYQCLRGEKKKPFTQNCFGKLTKYSRNGAVEGYGYDPVESIDCRTFCSARKVCVLFAKSKIKDMRESLKLGKQLDESMPFKQKNSIIAKAFTMCLDGTTRRKLKKFVEDQGGDITRILRVLRAEKHKDKNWKYDEHGKYIKIYFDFV